ncbi:hypothetical protein [Natrinema salsiterrestre]|uniref:Uncharacterized protein n=1 Tax=Natrinema salsiterrestre TaxID=2950540 RepID=A0A9Q4Q590_9EURY|nr:hypothetical protein [Natrinema salsiterrestre]MDF9747963.1 hypothetical protein [Natrinema salsiterrestre]
MSKSQQPTTTTEPTIGTDRKAEYDGFKTYTEENVTEARDERAQREGGQRNLAGEYE